MSCDSVNECKHINKQAVNECKYVNKQIDEL